VNKHEWADTSYNTRDRQCKNEENLFSLGWHGHIERINNERMPKQIVAARMEGTR
jgi:hypothetical protein